MQDVREYSNDELVALVPLPADDANKYARGTLSAVVGSERYPGAACLAAYASRRMGAGYTEVLTSPSAVPLVQGYRPSLVVRPRAALAANLPASTPDKPRAYLVGCGFNADDGGTEKLAHFVLKHADAPVLVDGTGLNALVSGKKAAPAGGASSRGPRGRRTPARGAHLASAPSTCPPATRARSRRRCRWHTA